MLSDEGKEITLYRLYPGDICMLSASCVMQSITFDVFVDAEVKSEVYIINSGGFAKLTSEFESEGRGPARSSHWPPNPDSGLLG